MNGWKNWLGRWLGGPRERRSGWGGTAGWTTLAGRCEAPASPGDPLSELRHTVYACASLNAAVCASYPPKLYALAGAGEALGFSTRRLRPEALERLAWPGGGIPEGVEVRQVDRHPLLDLLAEVNPEQDAQELWELTTLHQECLGSAFWLLEGDGPVPAAVWVLPPERVRVERGTGAVPCFQVAGSGGLVDLSAEQVIHFRYPDPRDCYGKGLGPLRAVLASAQLASQFVAYKRGLWENAALPGVVLTPEAPLGDEERERLEGEWNAKFRKGGNGRVLVADSSLKVSVVQNSLADLAALAEAGATKEDIANAFGVPMAYLTKETNLANLQAADRQHLGLTIRPRLRRRDQRLTRTLARRADPTGRLFFASDDPTPVERDYALRRQELDMAQGVRTINEVRRERGLDAVAWGDKPWVPGNWKQAE
jgi:HK97 family phage portal protein